MSRKQLFLILKNSRAQLCFLCFLMFKNQLATPATLATLNARRNKKKGRLMGANRKLETKCLCKPLQINNVTSCQLQPFYNRHMGAPLGRMISLPPAGVQAARPNKPIASRRHVLQSAGRDVRPDSRDDYSTRILDSLGQAFKPDDEQG
jgi:hypothetical protein